VQIEHRAVWYRKGNRSVEELEASPVAQIGEKFERFLETYRKPDGNKWGGQDLHNATGGVVTRSYVTSLCKGRIENPGFEKLRAIAKAMGFPPELWFEDVEDLGDVSGARPSWFLDGDDELALLDEEMVEALRDETARAVLREVGRLPERERGLVLRIVRQFQETSG
jgi:transcriptional regulator with XRE-family HTH domain